MKENVQTEIQGLLDNQFGSSTYFTQDDIKALAVLGDLSYDPKIFGLYTGALVTSLTRRNKKDGKKTAIYASGINTDYLFHSTLEADFIMVENSSAIGILENAGKEVDCIVLRNVGYAAGSKPKVKIVFGEKEEIYLFNKLLCSKKARENPQYTLFIGAKPSIPLDTTNWSYADINEVLKIVDVNPEVVKLLGHIDLLCQEAQKQNYESMGNSMKEIKRLTDLLVMLGEGIVHTF